MDRPIVIPVPSVIDGKVIYDDPNRVMFSFYPFGNRIISKFGKSSTHSYVSCFKENMDGQMVYRYYDEKHGRPHKIEVSADQYMDIVEDMRESILEGHLSGVTDPDLADCLVVKSLFSYDQLKELAQSGDYDGLKYDMVSGSIHCSCVFGASSYITYEDVYRETRDRKKAIEASWKATHTFMDL